MDTKTRSLSSSEILQNLPESIFAADLDGNVTYWNKASEQLFGYSRDEILDRSIEKVYSEEGKQQFQKHLKMLRQGKEVKGQWSCLKKDDSTVWINVNVKTVNDDGTPIAIVGTVSNITELKKVEKSLRESKAMIEAIFKSTVDGIVTINPEGRIRRFNQAASNIFGYQEKEVMGKSYQLLLPEKDRESRDGYFQAMLQSDSEELSGKRKEITGRKKDGTLFPLELSVSKAKWDHSQIFTAFISDISERRRLEQEILWISEEERQSIGQNMHDGLGQLLTGIGLITQTLARRMENLDKPEAKEVREIADMIKEADEQARALAHGLVNVGVEEDGLQISLERLCKQTEKLFNMECHLDIDHDIVINNTVTALNLYRITQEAISNAHKHGQARNIEVSLQAGKNCDYINLIIRNDGIPFKLDHDQKAGMGINIMKYRSKMIFGHLKFNQTDDNHTEVICRVPIDHCRIDAS